MKNLITTTYNVNNEDLVKLIVEEVRKLDVFRFTLEEFQEAYKNVPETLQRQGLLRLYLSLRKTFRTMSFETAHSIAAPLFGAPKPALRFGLTKSQLLKGIKEKK